MDRFVCIHGHFYQPPRENPWLEAVELQDSAYPYHDWNERITAECYTPNATARILDPNGRIAKIENNYGRLSFNFGPTLLAWMQTAIPTTYEDILESDRASRQRFSGHGSAIAQVYNHMIMPLANRRDKETQVIWGIQDFVHRFERKPEGLWLPETAVDLETLDILAEQGISFTVLAPHQAGKVREIGAEDWQDIGQGQIDPTMVYVQHLPSGRKINLFFYDGPVSRAVAFEKLLFKGEFLADRLMGAFNDERTRPQLVHIATDGETYGHHHKHGEMALAFALDYIQGNQLAEITNYGEFLARFPPTHQVDIIPETSWSCAHGVERWRSNCGCNGGIEGWTQEWRAPLRAALDWLRDAIARKYEKLGRHVFKDPWAARNDYIDVVVRRTPEMIEDFMATHSRTNTDHAGLVTGLKLLEMQRHAMFMYTSCGWFFDDISGVESSQVIQYAGRAVQLAESLFGAGIEAEFTTRLVAAKSNIPENRDGALIYEKTVKSSMVSLAKVGSHYGISSLFEDYGEHDKIYSYTVDRKDHCLSREGSARLAVGRAIISSDLTFESEEMAFGVLHFGDHNISGGVLENPDEDTYRMLVEETTDAFSRADLPAVIRILDKHLGESTESIRSLFRDEQRKVLGSIMQTALAGIEAEYRGIYDRHAGLMSYLASLHFPIPKDFTVPAERVVNSDLRRAIGSEVINLDLVATLIEEAKSRDIPIEADGISYQIDKATEDLFRRFAQDPTDEIVLGRLTDLVDISHIPPLHPGMAKAQDSYWEMLQGVFPRRRAAADKGDGLVAAWCDRFISLGRSLGFAVGQ